MKIRLLLFLTPLWPYRSQCCTVSQVRLPLIMLIISDINVPSEQRNVTPQVNTLLSAMVHPIRAVWRLLLCRICLRNITLWMWNFQYQKNFLIDFFQNYHDIVVKSLSAYYEPKLQFSLNFRYYMQLHIIFLQITVD